MKVFFDIFFPFYTDMASIECAKPSNRLINNVLRIYQQV